MVEKFCADPRRSLMCKIRLSQHLGAMNKVLLYLDQLTGCFWGSDDWAAGPTVLARLVAALENSIALNQIPDLLVCRGRYADSMTGSWDVLACFAGLDDGLCRYRRALFLALRRPHQPTLIVLVPDVVLHMHQASVSQLILIIFEACSSPGLLVQCLDLELVHMADGGVSGQQTQRRISEVARAYRRAFHWFWWLPFLMRYLRRIASLVSWKR